MPHDETHCTHPQRWAGLHQRVFRTYSRKARLIGEKGAHRSICCRTCGVSSVPCRGLIPSGCCLRSKKVILRGWFTHVTNWAIRAQNMRTGQFVVREQEFVHRAAAPQLGGNLTCNTIEFIFYQPQRTGQVVGPKKEPLQSAAAPQLGWNLTCTIFDCP